MNIGIAFAGCCALAIKDGVKNLSGRPDPIYERKLGPWRILLNGGASPAGSPEVPPYSAYVEFEGWPAGIVDPSGGIIVRVGDASEDSLIAALEAELGCPVMEALA